MEVARLITMVISLERRVSIDEGLCVSFLQNG